MYCAMCGTENDYGAKYCVKCGALLKSAEDAGQDNLGPYHLLGELGRGAMARVWRAWDPNLSREVAIKEPLYDSRLPSAVLDEMGRRFVREGVTAASLNHPNIVTIHTAAIYDGRPAIVMELIVGSTLSELMQHSVLGPEASLEVLDQLLDAASYAHAHGVIHRDIKPDNIFVTADGRVKLADFGIARSGSDAMTVATVAGSVLGTPGYMSPEQATGATVDARSDLFSIGVVAYEMFVGKHPFGAGDGADATTLLYRIVHEPVQELPEGKGQELPINVRPTIMRALSKNPDDRPQSAEEFKAMLHGDAVIEMPSKSFVGAAGQGMRDRNAWSNWLPYTIVGLVGAVALVAILINSLSGSRGAESAPIASQSVAVEQEVTSLETTLKTPKKTETAETSTKNEDATNPKQELDLEEEIPIDVETTQVYEEPQDTSTDSASINLSDTSITLSRAETFPRKWSGTYIGTSSYVGGDGHISRAVAFDFTTVSESGYLEGICYVGTDETGPGETYGTCTVSGNVDWDMNTIQFHGVAWIDQGGMGDLREYYGSIDDSYQSMGGSAGDVGTGKYETPWDVRAVDEIAIWQNGSLTVVS